MPPIAISSTFMLAESAIEKEDVRGDNKTNSRIDQREKVSSPPPTTASPSTLALSDDRLINGQMNSVDLRNTQKASSEMKLAETTNVQPKPYQVQIVWRNVVIFVILHSMTLYGLWLIYAERAYVEFFFTYIGGFFGGLGITAGVHRLWSHRAYKAKLPLRIFLMLCQSMAFQNSIHEWCRDHRVHHKFTDTDADPHNSRRGFFFAHMGWLMCKKHPDVKEKGKGIEMGDLEADPVVMFQKKYYFYIMPVCCFVVPTLVPYYCLGTSLRTSFFLCAVARYTMSLHGTWLVNSAAHFYGMKPYDINISSVESKLVAHLAFGEGWHNYHHVFPWDYKAAELGSYQYNWTTAFIDLMAKIGQAYDLKSVSKEMVLKRLRRTGDGSHPSMIDGNNNEKEITNEMVSRLDHNEEETLVWGWDDKDVTEFDRSSACIAGKKDE